jgi:hypothetical protein
MGSTNAKEDNTGQATPKARPSNAIGSIPQSDSGFREESDGHINAATYRPSSFECSPAQDRKNGIAKMRSMRIPTRNSPPLPRALSSIRRAQGTIETEVKRTSYRVTITFGKFECNPSPSPVHRRYKEI